MVKLTILSDKICEEMGNSPKGSNGDDEEVVNVRKELCGAFVNNMNMTFVNYTMDALKKQKYKRLSDFDDI